MTRCNVRKKRKENVIIFAATALAFAAECILRQVSSQREIKEGKIPEIQTYQDEVFI